MLDIINASRNAVKTNISITLSANEINNYFSNILEKLISHIATCNNLAAVGVLFPTEYSLLRKSHLSK